MATQLNANTSTDMRITLTYSGSILLIELIIVLLRIFGVIHWHWIWVLSPIWLPTVLLLASVLVITLFAKLLLKKDVYDLIVKKQTGLTVS